MRIYLAGNFEHMDDIESELRTMRLVIERGGGKIPPANFFLHERL
mgnify:CR=1 FL=1